MTIRVDRRAIAMKQTDALAAAGATDSTVDRTSDADTDQNPGTTPGSSQSGQ